MKNQYWFTQQETFRVTRRAGAQRMRFPVWIMQVLKHRNKNKQTLEWLTKTYRQTQKSSPGLKRHHRTLHGIFFTHRALEYPFEYSETYSHLHAAFFKGSNHNYGRILLKWGKAIRLNNVNKKTCLASRLPGVCWMSIGKPSNGMKTGQEISSNSFSEEWLRNWGTAWGCRHWFSHYWTRSSFRAGSPVLHLCNSFLPCFQLWFLTVDVPSVLHK